MNAKPMYEEPCRETQVSRELSRLQHNVEVLRGFVAELEHRLIPVTRSLEEEPSKVEPVPEVVPFADNLRNVSFSIESSADRLERLLKTLEI